MENEIEIPPYAQMPPRKDEVRSIVFENDQHDLVRKSFACFDLKVLNAWSDDQFGRVVLENGDIAFRVRPGFSVFVAVRAA